MHPAWIVCFACLVFVVVHLFVRFDAFNKKVKVPHSQGLKQSSKTFCFVDTCPVVGIQGNCR